MDSFREVLEREIEGSKAALNAHEEGIKIHNIVQKAFEEELKKYPKKKDDAPIHDNTGKA